jgi:hypothetical protein
LTADDSKLKISINRSSVPAAIVIAVLLAATPFVVWECVRAGELYVLSHRFVDGMVARLHGPGRMRFILQPTIAIILRVRDGVRDGRAGSAPFLSAPLFLRTRRRELVRGAPASIRDLVAVAILLDFVSQLLIFRITHPRGRVTAGAGTDSRRVCFFARGGQSHRTTAE